eukprot:TRINITY_DN6361_c0_g1_i1.p1 TRINITY_DN6361_c0_g1~~TRINITY_DN6361_c0_g1_i1.p1  ORF type:complete len:214 (+),score=29.43 TRINITY_DN6361_c0_g1_i1:548-1189(+)
MAPSSPASKLRRLGLIAAASALAALLCSSLCPREPVNFVGAAVHSPPRYWIDCKRNVGMASSKTQLETACLKPDWKQQEAVATSARTLQRYMEDIAKRERKMQERAKKQKCIAAAYTLFKLLLPQVLGAGNYKSGSVRLDTDQDILFDAASQSVNTELTKFLRGLGSVTQYSSDRGVFVAALVELFKEIGLRCSVDNPSTTRTFKITWAPHSD